MKVKYEQKVVRSLPCHKCNRIVENVGEEAAKVTCSWCILQVVGIKLNVELKKRCLLQERPRRKKL